MAQICDHGWSVTHFLFLFFRSDLYEFWVLVFLKPCLWILILNFQFMLIKLKWVWLDMFYSRSIIKNIPKKKHTKKKKKTHTHIYTINVCVRRNEAGWSFEFWSCGVKLIRLCSLKEPLVFVKSSAWTWPLLDHGSLRCVCNYKNAIITLFP